MCEAGVAEYPEIPEFIKNLMASGIPIDEIRIDQEGRWFHNGEPFLNKQVIEFFNRSVDVTEEGDYVIHYGDFVYPIVVEDTPVFVTGVRYTGFGEFEKVYLTLSTGESEELNPDLLFFRANNCLYTMVRNGLLPARFKRSPSFHILDRLEESDDIFYLRICGKRIVLKEKV